MRILVTGGAGFIGSNFVRMIGEHKFQGISGVKVLDKLTYAGVEANLDPVADLKIYEFIEGDICDPQVASQLLSDCGEIEAIVNFAAESHVDRSISGAADFVQTNIKPKNKKLFVFNAIKVFLNIFVGLQKHLSIFVLINVQAITEL